MTVYSVFSSLILGVQRNVDLSSNTLAVSNIRIGTSSDYATFDTSVVSGAVSIKFPSASLDLGNLLPRDLAETYIFVGNASNKAVAVAVSGDITISNAGVATIGATRVTNAMLAGSIQDSKLSQITTANKVAGSAVQLASGGGIQNASGLEVKVSEFVGDGVEDNGSNAIRVKLDGATLARSASGIKVNTIADAQIAALAAIAVNKLAAVTSNRALASDVSGFIVASAVLDTELAHLSGVTGAIQTQLNAKAALAGASFTGAIDLSNHKITSLGTPSNAGDAATKAYVDTAVISGGRVKEAILSSSQLSNAQGILPAALIDIEAQPIVDDTIVITNGTVTETWTFKASRTGAFEVAIGADHPATMANLASAIASDSASSSGVFDAALLVLDGDGVVIVTDKTTTVLPSITRIYGTWGTQASCQIISFHGDIEYSTNKVSINLPSADPVTSQFGFGRKLADLIDGEIHVTLDSNEQKSWNASLVSWVTMSGGGSVADATSASGGGVKGKVTFDSDKGLSVSSGVASVKVDASTINFSSGSLYVPNSAIGANQLAGQSVGYAKLGSVAGNGLTGGAGALIAVLNDGTSLAVSGSGVKVNYDNATIGLISTYLAVLDNSISAAKLTTGVAGNGLAGGNGTALHVVADATGGANLAKAINVSVNGVAVKVDGTSIDGNGSNQLEVVPGGVDHAQLYNLNSSSYTHLSATNAGLLTGAGDTSLHYHSADRARANHSGTQAASTISDFASVLETDVAGLFSSGTHTAISVTHAAGSLSLAAKYDNSTIEVNGSNQLYVASAGITSTQLAASVAGNGLTGGAGTALSVVAASNKAIDVSASGVAVKYDNSTVGINGTNQLYVPNAGITSTQLAAAVAGNGLTGGAGTALSVVSDATGGANLAKAINVSANGVAVKIDSSTIGANGSNQLYVPNAGITETQIASSSLLSTGGLQGGSGTKLSVKLDGSSLSSSSNGLKVTSSPSSIISIVTDVTLAANHTYAVRMSISGETAGRIYLADNDATSSDLFYVLGCVAVASSAYSQGDIVPVVLSGSVACSSDVNFGSLTIGKPVYLGAAGVLTTTAPSAVNSAVYRIGIVSATGSGTSALVVCGSGLNGIN